MNNLLNTLKLPVPPRPLLKITCPSGQATGSFLTPYGSYDSTDGAGAQKVWLEDSSMSEVAKSTATNTPNPMGGGGTWNTNGMGQGLNLGSLASGPYTLYVRSSTLNLKSVSVTYRPGDPNPCHSIAFERAAARSASSQGIQVDGAIFTDILPRPTDDRGNPMPIILSGSDPVSFTLGGQIPNDADPKSGLVLSLNEKPVRATVNKNLWSADFTLSAGSYTILVSAANQKECLGLLVQKEVNESKCYAH
jgi:hypothetical protein